MITNSFDVSTPAIINPQRKENAPKADAVIITFSYLIEEYVKTHFDVVQIATLDSVNGDLPIYAFEHNGKKICFYKTFIGAPCTAGLIEELLSQIEVEHFVMFGGAGCLDNEIARGKIMVPTEAYRDEGTSYHYMPPSDYVTISNASIVAEFMKKEKIPFVLGNTWTTDAMYRETRGNFEKRKKEGCISVEMECSAVQAVCNFRQVKFYNFLKAGDLLDAPEWDPRYEFSDISTIIGCGSQHDPRYFYIALDLACFVCNR